MFKLGTLSTTCIWSAYSFYIGDHFIGTPNYLGMLLAFAQVLFLEVWIGSPSNRTDINFYIVQHMALKVFDVMWSHTGSVVQYHFLALKQLLLDKFSKKYTTTGILWLIIEYGRINRFSTAASWSSSSGMALIGAFFDAKKNHEQISHALAHEMN